MSFHVDLKLLIVIFLVSNGQNFWKTRIYFVIIVCPRFFCAFLCNLLHLSRRKRFLFYATYLYLPICNLTAAACTVRSVSIQNFVLTRDLDIVWSRRDPLETVLWYYYIKLCSALKIRTTGKKKKTEITLSLVGQWKEKRTLKMITMHKSTVFFRIPMSVIKPLCRPP